MKLYLNVVEVAIEHDEKFLIIKRPEGKHAGGLLSFPGGKVEEIDEQNEWDILRLAAKREILEEVGLDLKDELKYIISNYFVDSIGAHVIDTIFHCKIDKTDLTVNASAREVPEYYWLTEEEINKAHNAPEWLKKYVQYIRRTP
ncbi:MAG: NUDIX domain-containing protein [Rickettsiaceae bacterium]|nr:NUDIX domain-containing protein [Rickettsiaceae bacterium]